MAVVGFKDQNRVPNWAVLERFRERLLAWPGLAGGSLHYACSEVECSARCWGFELIAEGFLGAIVPSSDLGEVACNYVQSITPQFGQSGQIVCDVQPERAYGQLVSGSSYVLFHPIQTLFILRSYKHLIKTLRDSSYVVQEAVGGLLYFSCFAGDTPFSLRLSMSDPDILSVVCQGLLDASDDFRVRAGIALTPSTTPEQCVDFLLRRLQTGIAALSGYMAPLKLPENEVFQEPPPIRDL